MQNQQSNNQAETKQRFIIVNESKSGHCCFCYSVIDKQQKDCYGQDKIICETFEHSDAVMICEALNLANK